MNGAEQREVLDAFISEGEVIFARQEREAFGGRQIEGMEVILA